MTKSYYPFDSGQQVKESEWSKMARNWRSDGVLVAGNGMLSSGGDLAVSQGSGLTMNIASGTAWIQGHYFESTATENVTLQTNNGAVGPRIDLVVLELDWVNNKIDFKAVKGTAAPSPNPPNLTRNTSIYQIPLAEVTISNTDVVTNVKDTREPSTHVTFKNVTVIRKTATYTLTGTAADIVWEEREIDTLNQSSNNSALITVKEDGMYRIGAYAALKNSASGPVGDIVKLELVRVRAGSPEPMGNTIMATPGGTQVFGVQVERLLNVKKGDQFKVQILKYGTNVTTQMIVNGTFDYSRFWAERIGNVGNSPAGVY